MIKKIASVLLFTCMTFSAILAQDKKRAEELFENKNYAEALGLYLKLLEGQPDDYNYNFRAGVCYLETSVDKSKSIPYLNKSTSLSSQDPIAFYLLGKSYQYSYQFDAAIRSFEKFMALSDASEENVKYAKKKIEYCYNAKEFMKFPLDITLENLGENINSPFPDYFPFVPADESAIIYNSQRDDGSTKQNNGRYGSNIYISKVENGNFTKANKLSFCADAFNEKVIGLSANGKKILYSTNEIGKQGIYMADLADGTVQNQEKLLLPLLIDYEKELTASISTDGNVLFIAGEFKGGFGGSDIYVLKKLPNGEWSAPRNLGPTVNTEWSEKFPNIAPDGKTLYFSSAGHTGIGGLDIYKVNLDQNTNTWTSLKNMGYPLNTPEDNMNFRVSVSGNHGYISTDKGDDGLGDLDIYRVKFNEIAPRYSIITGNLYSINKTKLKDGIFISVTNLENDERVGEYTPNSRTGRYVMALPPGKYQLYVEADGFKEIDQRIEVLDKSSFESYVYQDMVLKPKGILMKLPELQEE